MDEYAGFNEFVAAYTPALSRLAYLLAGDHAGAEDLLQVAFTKSGAALAVGARVRQPEAFVRTVMYHEAVTGWRRRRRSRERAMAEPPEPPSPLDEATAVERRVVLERALRGSPRASGRCWSCASTRTAARRGRRMLGCSVGTVKSQTHHALTRLRVLAPGTDRPGGDAMTGLSDLLSEVADGAGCTRWGRARWPTRAVDARRRRWWPPPRPVPPCLVGLTGGSARCSTSEPGRACRADSSGCRAWSRPAARCHRCPGGPGRRASLVYARRCATPCGAVVVLPNGARYALPAPPPDRDGPGRGVAVTRRPVADLPGPHRAARSPGWWSAT